MRPTAPVSWRRRVMATNVDAVFFLSQAVLPTMRDGGYGRIVIVASMYGSLTLNPDQYDSFPDDDVRRPIRQPAYHTSKRARCSTSPASWPAPLLPGMSR